MKYLEKYEKFNKDNTILNISKKDLSEFPKEFLPLQSILKLYCGHNRLKELPVLPEGLLYLDCCNNKLKKLPIIPESVQTLICHNNKFDEPIDYLTFIKFFTDTLYTPITMVYTKEQRKHFTSTKFHINLLMEHPEKFMNLIPFGITNTSNPSVINIRRKFLYNYDSQKLILDNIETSILLDIIEEHFPDWIWVNDIKEEYDYIFNSIDMGLL